MATVPASRPAATVVLFRNAAEGPPELLMLERAANMAFAAGMLVFPGGRVDDADLALAGGDPDRAGRIAAIRETIEEAGIAIGLTPAPTPATVAAVRAGLAAGAPFATLLARAGLDFDLARLEPFARWRPHIPHARNFDTRFYLAEFAADATVTVDGTECVTARWATAAAFLTDDRIIFPTRRNLERLARYADHAAAVADAARYPMTTITPRIETREGQPWLTIPEGMGYPVTSQALDEVRRG